MQDIIVLCRDAWNSTKGESQPAYDDLVYGYQHMLGARASGVIATGVISDDAPFANFERTVLELNSKPEVAPEIPPDVKEELVAEAVEEQTAVQPAPEPEVEKERLELKGPLPKDFPSHEKLHEAGVNTYGQLGKVEDLTAIEGIGPAGAKNIKKQLKADEKALNK